MAEINWAQITHFSPGEFPADPDRYADPELIRRLDRFRELAGRRVFPSPIERGFVRLDRSDADSMHFCDADGAVRSRAIDVFAEGAPLKNWITAISCGLWGGVGVYFGTFYGARSHLWPMLHLDIRPADGPPVMWCRTPDKNYRYFMRLGGQAMEELIRLFSTYGMAERTSRRIS